MAGVAWEVFQKAFLAPYSFSLACSGMPLTCGVLQDSSLPKPNADGLITVGANEHAGCVEFNPTTISILLASLLPNDLYTNSLLFVFVSSHILIEFSVRFEHVRVISDSVDIGASIRTSIKPLHFP